MILRLPLLTTALFAPMAMGVVPALAEGTDCMPAQPPVVTLEYGSRYQEDDETRSAIDEQSNDEVNRALRPVDDFIQDLARDANKVLRERAEAADLAACLRDQIALWARADALSDLRSYAARLSVGARLAGIAEAYRQIRPFVPGWASEALVAGWLTRRAEAQIRFWEDEATEGARVGNLRAWAALAVDLTGEVTESEAYRDWAAASVRAILCTARPDGSLPQETKRGRFALHYQLHALSPLVTLAARYADTPRDLRPVCNGALARAVDFALRDLDEKGAASESYSEVKQSYFDGTEKLNAHELAWLPAFVVLYPDSPHKARLDAYESFGSSKLGGDQQLVRVPAEPEHMTQP